MWLRKTSPISVRGTPRRLGEEGEDDPYPCLSGPPTRRPSLQLSLTNKSPPVVPPPQTRDVPDDYSSSWGQTYREWVVARRPRGTPDQPVLSDKRGRNRNPHRGDPSGRDTGQVCMGPPVNFRSDLRSPVPDAGEWSRRGSTWKG